MHVHSFRTLNMLILAAFFVTACGVAVEPRPVFEPARPMPQPTAFEREVELVTTTPMPTVDPNLPIPTRTPFNNMIAPAATHTPLAFTDSFGGLQMGMVVDPAANIQLAFPAGWSITPVDEERKAQADSYTTLIESPLEAYAGGQQMFLALTVEKNAENYEKSLEMRLARYDRDGWKVESSSALALPSGEPATIWWLNTPNGQAAELLTVIDGRTIILNGRGDLFLFNPIAATLQRQTATKPGG